MPIDEIPDIPTLAMRGVGPMAATEPAGPPAPGPSAWEISEASRRRENDISNIPTVEEEKEAGLRNFTDPDYMETGGAWERIKGTKYEKHWNSFLDVNNPRQEAVLKAKLDQEEDDDRTRAASGWMGVGTDIFWSLASPTTLIPGGGAVRAVKGGYSVAKSALTVGGLAAGSIAVQEGILQANQETRPWEESAIAVGAGAVLGGLLGGGAAAILSRAERKTAETAARVLYHAAEPRMAAVAGGEALASPLTDIITRVRAGEQVSSQEIIAAARGAVAQAHLGDEGGERIARIADQIEPLVRGLEREVVRSTADDLLVAARSSFGSDGARLVDEGAVKIVQSVEELPKRPDGQAHPNDVRGVFDGKTAHIVADNVAPDEVKGVLLHEVGVHYGMQRMIGDAQYKALLDDVQARAVAGEQAFAEALARVPADTPVAHRAEEALAYLVENAPESGLVARVISSVRNWLRQTFGGKFSGLSESDIRQLAVSALRKWNPEAKPAKLVEPRYARNTSTDIRMDMRGMVRAAKEMASWNDWYERYQADLQRLFGRDTGMLQQMLSATSQATGVAGNVTLALKAYRQFLAGEEFTGFLPAVIKNLQRIRDEQALRGQKIGEYGKANQGDETGIAVDRHIAELFFDTKMPTAAQVAAAKVRINAIAAELGWPPKGVQAALWAYNIVRKGGEPQSYDTFLRAKEAEIARLRAQYGRGEGAGVPDGGAVGGPAGDAGRAAEGPGGAGGAGGAGEPTDIRYSRSKAVAENVVSENRGKDAEVAPMARLIDDSRIPDLDPHKLVGETIFPTIADRTAAGAVYKGVDGSELKTYIPLLGGPGFPTMEGNVKAGVAWANRGKGITASKSERAKAGQLMAIVMGSSDMHASNTTVARAVFQTMEAYIRDGRIPPENVAKIDDILREALTTGKVQVEGFPGLAAGREVEDWFDKLSFDKRERFVGLLGSPTVQKLGGPSLNKILDATRDPAAAGMRWGDVSLIVRLDPERPYVKLGTEGTMEHPDYPHGVRGEIVGRLRTPINYQELWSPWMEESGSKFTKPDQRQYTFGRVKPTVTITKEMADRLAKTQTQAISNARQARLAVDFGAERWKVSGKTITQGGISPQEFVNAIKESPASATLTKYTASEVTKAVKAGDMRVFQLGDDGRVWFALKKGSPADGYDGVDAKAMGFGDKEVTLTSVVNNEQGVRGIPGEAIMLKAIQEGATALDAFAVQSSRFPNGFLPAYYAKFGFREVGRTKFDPKFYNANELADLKKFWKETGWKESDGYPDVAFMKWEGTDADRGSFARSYLGRGADGVPGGAGARDVGRARDASPDFIGRTVGRGADAVPGPEGGRGGNAGSPVASRLGSVLQSLRELPDDALRNLGITRADVDALRYSRAGASRTDRIAAQLEQLARALDSIDDPAADAMMAASRAGADVGAAAVSGPSLEDLSIAGKAARAYAGAVRSLNPNLRSNFRAVAGARRYPQELAESTVYQNMHAEGRTQGAAVETLARANYQARIFQSASEHQDIFAAAKKTKVGMTKVQFEEAVGRAMRRGDVGENEFVTKAAQAWRRNMFDPYKDEAIAARLLPPGVTPETAESYMPRMYDRERLIADEQGFKDKVTRYYAGAAANEYKAHAQTVRTRIAELDAELARLRMAPEDRVATLTAKRDELKALEAGNIDKVEVAERITKLRSAVRKANETGDRAAATKARDEIDRIRKDAGSDFDAFMRKRLSLRGELRQIDMNYAGMTDRQNRILGQIADVEESNLRSMNRLVARGRRFEVEAGRLDPEKHAERLADLRTAFADEVQRSEKTAQRIADARAKIEDEYQKALLKAQQDREAGGMREATAATTEAKADAKKAEAVKKIDAQLAAQEKAERARTARLSSLAERIDNLESFSPAERLLELRRTVDQLAADISSDSLGRGEKAARLRERYESFSPERAKAREEAIIAMKKDAERAFYDRWEIKNAGEGVDLTAAGARVNFSAFARQIADEVYDKILGRSNDAISAPDFITPLKSGPLKERTFNVPDDLIEDYLEHNIVSAAERYGRSMGAQIEMTNRFGRADMADQLRQIRDEYRELRAEVSAAKTGEEAAAAVGRSPGAMDSLRAWMRDTGKDKVTKERVLRWLAKDEEGAVEDLEAMRDLILGRYKVQENASDYGRLVRSLNAFNYVRAMGGALIANITEIYRPAMVHGLGRFFSEGVAPLLTNLDAVKLSVREAQLAGQVVERVVQNRIMSLGEVGDPYRSGTAIERLLQNGTRLASRWNGLIYWTDAMQAVSSILSQNRILEGALGKADDKRFLAFLGIDGFMAGRIADQFKAHGKIKDGVHIAGTEAWTDPQAVRAYRAAISKDVDSIIVTKGVGDTPLFANTPTGKMLLQFRTFNLAANQRVLLRAMQEDQKRFVSGIVGLASLGMLAATARSWRGGEDRWERFKNSAQNPGYLIGEGLDLTGIFSLPFEVANTTEKLTQGTQFSFNPIKTPLMRAFPGQSQQGESTRFVTRGVAGALGGPTIGLLDTGQRALNGKPKDLAQLIPFNSYLGMREAIQALTGDSPYLD